MPRSHWLCPCWFGPDQHDETQTGHMQYAHPIDKIQFKPDNIRSEAVLTDTEMQFKSKYPSVGISGPNLRENFRLAKYIAGKFEGSGILVTDRPDKFIESSHLTTITSKNLSPLIDTHTPTNLSHYLIVDAENLDIDTKKALYNVIMNGQDLHIATCVMGRHTVRQLRLNMDYVYIKCDDSMDNMDMYWKTYFSNLTRTQFKELYTSHTGAYMISCNGYTNDQSALETIKFVQV